MYKDRPEVNHRNYSDFLKVLHEEALWLKKYYVDHEDKKTLEAILLPKDEIYAPNKKYPKKHHPEHEGCDGINNPKSTKLTEKRICRCMYYYSDTSKKCQNCLLQTKWKNKEIIRI